MTHNNWAKTGFHGIGSIKYKLRYANEILEKIRFVTGDTKAHSALSAIIGDIGRDLAAIEGAINEKVSSDYHYFSNSTNTLLETAIAAQGVEHV